MLRGPKNLEMKESEMAAEPQNWAIFLCTISSFYSLIISPDVQAHSESVVAIVQPKSRHPVSRMGR